MSRGRTLIRAAMVVDGDAVRASPGALLVEDDVILAAGSPQSVGAPADATIVDAAQEVLIPALVNTHCHLDLTHIGPVPYAGDFIGWIDRVRTSRATEPDAVASSVRRGVRLSRAGGTAVVGDIAGAGSIVPAESMRAEGLAGVSYVEFFGIGRREGDGIAAMRRGLSADVVGAALGGASGGAAGGVSGGVSRGDSGGISGGGVRIGVQPHAPYSCGLEMYRAAVDLGLPLATHLAETPAEIEFTIDRAGPLADLLRALDIWDDTIRPPAAGGLHPIEHLAGVLAAASFVVAHVNYTEPRHLKILADRRATVAYCPRASAYFGHPAEGFPPHAYRAMREAGVNVAIGTDSLLCLDTPDRISVLDEIRLLFRRDGDDPRALLAMATVAGARGLGFDPGLVTLAPGPTAGVLAVPYDVPAGTGDPLAAILRADTPPRWVIGPITGDRLDDAGPSEPGTDA